MHVIIERSHYKNFQNYLILKKKGSSSNLIFVNHIKTFHHFTIERLISSPSSFAFESFLFIKKINVNEFIQFVKSLTLALINIDNFKNKLISHTSQSSSFSSIHIL